LVEARESRISFARRLEQDVADSNSISTKLSLRKFLLLGVLALPAVVAGIWFTSGKSVELPQGVTEQEYALAAREFELEYKRTADYFDVVSWLAEDSVARNDDQRAEYCFDLIPNSHLAYGHSARFQQGQVLVRLHRAHEAEQNLREFLELENQSSQLKPIDRQVGLQRLRHLLEVQLRFEERVSVLRELVETETADTFETMAFCFPTLLRWNGPTAVTWLEEFWTETPQDFRLRVALGRYRAGQGRMQEAHDILQGCIEEQPANLPAQAAMLDCLREINATEKFDDLFAKLPPRGKLDPWLLLRLRGRVYNQQGDYSQAVLCFQQVLESDAANPESLLGLASAYRGIQQLEKRKAALQKSEVLARIQNRLGWSLNRETEIQPMIEIAELAMEIDLLDEALAVVKLVQRLDPDNRAGNALLSRLESRTKR
jgi:tetratricopeptide (TPR) repeat protein